MKHVHAHICMQTPTCKYNRMICTAHTQAHEYLLNGLKMRGRQSYAVTTYPPEQDFNIHKLSTNIYGIPDGLLAVIRIVSTRAFQTESLCSLVTSL